ncbi:hypothetical protein JTB14_005879 [Gonioctena quinquepunctata]|nr:hypothetical protein JTB14_005879 [Gonioctena quinquepunctata]
METGVPNIEVANKYPALVDSIMDEQQETLITKEINEIKPPPIIINDKKNWPAISQFLRNTNLKSAKNFNDRDGIKVIYNEMETYQKCIRTLEQHKIQHFTFKTKNEREIRAIFRGNAEDFPIEDITNDSGCEIGNDRPGSPTDTTVTLPPEQGVGLTSPFGPSHGYSLILEPEETQNQWRPNIDMNKVPAPERRVTFSENAGSGRHGFVRNGPPQETSEVKGPIEKLAEILLRSLGNNNKAKIDRQILPTFSGLDMENPKVFVTKMIAELQKCEIPVDEWVLFIRYQLKGKG